MSPETLFLKTCNSKGLIIDTNVLLILLVGLYSPAYIKQCGRTSRYCENDYIYLVRLIEQTKARIIVTPHILAEVSNLTFHKNMITEPGLTKYIKALIGILTTADEIHPEKSKLLCNEKLLAKFGFTDLSIVEAARELNCAVLTNEGDLFGLLSSQKYPVWNIDFVRNNAQAAV